MESKNWHLAEDGIGPLALSITCHDYCGHRENRWHQAYRDSRHCLDNALASIGVQYCCHYGLCLRVPILLRQKKKAAKATHCVSERPPTVDASESKVMADPEAGNTSTSSSLPTQLPQTPSATVTSVRGSIHVSRRQTNAHQCNACPIRSDP